MFKRAMFLCLLTTSLTVHAADTVRVQPVPKKGDAFIGDYIQKTSVVDDAAGSKPVTKFNSVTVERNSNGTLFLSVQTYGDHYMSCDIQGDARPSDDGKSVLFEDEPTNCHLSISKDKKGSLQLVSMNCAAFCGDSAQPEGTGAGFKLEP